MITEAPDPLYIAARKTLLDALEALQPHIDSLILVGAQAVYLRTERSSLGIAPYTADGDLALNPESLRRLPPLEEIMGSIGFTRTGVGAWTREALVDGEQRDMVVDLLVPEQVAPGRGQRGVDLAGHDRLATRRTLGLEAALVDHDRMAIQALDIADCRSVTAKVAGPAGLLVAKVQKISERAAAARPDRLRDKDAADIYRMFQVIDASEMSRRLLQALASPVAEAVTSRAIESLGQLFGRRGGEGISMVVRAVGQAGPREAEIRALCTTYVARISERVR